MDFMKSIRSKRRKSYELFSDISESSTPKYCKGKIQLRLVNMRILSKCDSGADVKIGYDPVPQHRFPKVLRL